MAINEKMVAAHYTNGTLLNKILEGLAKSGLNPDNLQAEDLAPVEEFHIGGRAATAYISEKMSFPSDSHVLDVGCGIGGAARFLAHQNGCQVTGIDLTDEFITTGQELNRLTNLDDKVTLKTASALSLPYPDHHFDSAITLHVAMNIEDRPGLYAETARVLKPGAKFCIYDVMKTNDTAPTYPVPWAETAETSHLTSPEEMRALLSDAGLEILSEEDRHDFAMAFFEKSLAAMKGKQPPALSLNLIMGESAPAKFKNMLENIKKGCISPVQMICVKR